MVEVIDFLLRLPALGNGYVSEQETEEDREIAWKEALDGLTSLTESALETPVGPLISTESP